MPLTLSHVAKSISCVGPTSDLSPSVEPQFAESLRTGLKTLGFEVLTVLEGSPSILEVTVTKLVYRGFDVRNRQDFFVTHRMAISGNAIVRKGNVTVFEKPYDLLHEWQRGIGGDVSANRIQEEINKFASDFLLAILEDTELITTLK